MAGKRRKSTKRRATRTKGARAAVRGLRAEVRRTVNTVTRPFGVKF